MSTRPPSYPRVVRNILPVLALLGLLLLATTPPPARATVYNIADGDVAALLAAIQFVHGNSEVTVNLASNGTYTFEQQVGGATLSTIINASLTINGNGATIARSSASGTPAFNFFSIGEGTLTLKDLTLRNGSGTDGGAIESSACNLRLTNVTFSGNHAGGNGGALALSSCTVDMTTVTFSDNHATGNGGALSLDANTGTAIRDSSFLNNSAGGDGGGINNEGQLSVDNSTFRDNSGQNGGALALAEQTDNTASITNSTFSTNTATNGGALLLSGPNTVAVGNSILSGNHAGYGGAIYGTGIQMSVDRSLIISNTAEFQGGGIYLPGRLTIQFSTLAANTAGAGSPASGQQGGGIYAATGSTLACTSCTIRDNQAGDQGGGLYLARLQLDSEITAYGFTASTINGNSAVTEGGGVYLAGTNYRPGPGVPPHVNFEQSTISGNRVEATYTTSFDHCVGSYCGWFPEAWQYPASQPCAPNGAHITYVGDVHGDSGTETASDDFYPEYGALRICLYARQGDSTFFIAETVYYSGPAPNRRVGFTVGDQSVSFYYPKSCVTPGRSVLLQVQTKKKRKSKAPHTTVKRVDFRLDGLKRTDKKKPWEATFSTEGFLPGSTHTAAAKITFKQPHGKKVRKKVKKTFTVC